MLPQKILTLTRSEMLFYTFSWRYFLQKSVLEKVKLPGISRDYKEFFQFLYSASVTENIHHTLTPRPLFIYSLDSPETVKSQSHSKKVFSLNYSIQLTIQLTHKKSYYFKKST